MCSSSNRLRSKRPESEEMEEKMNEISGIQASSKHRRVVPLLTFSMRLWNMWRCEFAPIRNLVTLCFNSSTVVCNTLTSAFSSCNVLTLTASACILLAALCPSSRNSPCSEANWAALNSNFDISRLISGIVLSNLFWMPSMSSNNSSMEPCKWSRLATCRLTLKLALAKRFCSISKLCNRSPIWWCCSSFSCRFIAFWATSKSWSCWRT